MSWSLRTVDGARFDEIAFQLGRPHVFQSSGWAAVRERSGWRPHFLAIEGDEGWEAAFLCLERARFGLSVLQLPRGPVFRTGSERPRVLARVLAALRSLARERLVAYVQASPDLEQADTWAAPLFRAAGARPSPAPIGHLATLRLDLVRPEDELFARMESRTRYAIRKALEAGLCVRGGTDPGLLEDFQALYRETCVRAGIPPAPARLPAALVQAGIARAYVGYLQEQPTSAALVLRHGGGAWYLLGGSRRGVKHTGAELLQWTAIREARSAGVRSYDLQGIPQRPEKEDPAYGVYLFKRGFGGERVDLLGEFEMGSPPFVRDLGSRALSTLSRLKASACLRRIERS